ncbi:ATP-binding protein [Turicimonas muris]|uniref:ATP-binding protein n=1 Tax=Turicimonas muris TaxID=1796652 RepID=UPI003F66A70A
MITSNRPPSEWGLVFGDPTAATAILDRLLHHCTAVVIQGDSYRLRDNLRGLGKTEM